MTPTHQRLIDKLLSQIASRTQELLAGMGLRLTREPPIEELRASPLGQHLANLAHYAEGYSASGDIRESAQYVGRHFFGDPLHRQTFKLPEKFHRTELGALINEAMVRFYEEERPGQLLTMEEMRVLFNVKRQAVHQWIKDGLIVPVYIDNASRFYRKDVERLQERREAQRKMH